jgi:hypothetical protein
MFKILEVDKYCEGFYNVYNEEKKWEEDVPLFGALGKDKRRVPRRNH